MWAEFKTVASILVAGAAAAGWLTTRWQLKVSLRQSEDLANSALVIEEERRLLELMASGASLTEVLDSLTRAIERISPGSLCTVMLLESPLEGEAPRFLMKGSGPSLPNEYFQTLDRLEIGPDVGACGSAAFRNETVVVEDIATDYRFAQGRDFVMSYGLRSCWSVPIRDSRSNVLGTFAMYHRVPAKPRPEELRMTRAAAQLAGNAVERVRAEQSLRETAVRLNLAERVAQFGIFEADFTDASITVSAGMAAMMERSEGPLRINVAEFDALVHPDDLAALRLSANLAAADGETVQSEYRLVLPSGAVRWFRSRMRFEFSGGVLKRGTGALIDITEEKDMLARLQQARAAAEAFAYAAGEAGKLEQDRKNVLELVAKDRPLHQIAASIVDAVERHFPGTSCSIQIDLPDGTRLSVSPRLPARLAKTLAGLPVGSMVQMPAWAPIGQLSSDPGWRHCLENCPDLSLRQYRGAPIVRNARVSGLLLLRGGETAATGPGGREDNVLESWGQFASLAVERRGLYDQLSWRAQYDSLTSLLNRASLYELLDAQIARSARENASLALVYLDLDYFKEINDRHGHGTGDEVLQKVSRRILQSVRRTDIAARIGGDEFVVVLPGIADRAEATRVGALIVNAIGQDSLKSGQNPNVAATFGVSIFPDDGNQADTLIRMADEEMYRAKITRGHAERRRSDAVPGRR